MLNYVWELTQALGLLHQKNIKTSCFKDIEKFYRTAGQVNGFIIKLIQSCPTGR
jgi:hypothetical protein